MSVLLLLLLGGCPYLSAEDAASLNDPDGDGLSWDEDCDNQDRQVHGASTFFRDADGDGFGDPDTLVLACALPEGAVRDSGDCDDAQSEIHPDAEEHCDLVDNDCDGETDEDDAIDVTLFYRDADGDGYGGVTQTESACSASSGYVADATDCDDADPNRYPTATEVCGDAIDEDCDGTPNDCTVLWGTVDLDAARATLSGSESAQAGVHVADGGDLDGDGLEDLLVAATGQAFAVPGPTLGEAMLDDLAMAVFDATPTAQPVLSSAGDLDADGFGDMLLGDPDAGAGGDAGLVLVSYGPLTSGLAASTATLTGEIPDATGSVGSALGKGNLTDDGYADVVVGAPTFAAKGLTSAGAAYVVSGPEIGCGDLGSAAVRVYGEVQGMMLGTSLSSDTDFSGDGLDDLVVGVPGASYSRGGAYVWLGPLTPGVLTLDGATSGVRGLEPKDRAGTVLIAAGDVDADGYGDLLLASDPKTRLTPTAAWLLRGPVTATTYDLADAVATFASPDASDGAGASVAGGIDINLDGYDDLLVGAPDADLAGTGAGTAFLAFGPLTGACDLSTTPARIVGDLASDALGVVAGTGDLTGDDIPDFAVAAPLSDYTGNDGGAVYVFGAEAGL